MKRLLAALASMPAAVVAAAPVGYEFDPDYTFVYFEVLHFGTSTLRGRFGLITGSATLDPAHSQGEVGVRIQTGSASTGVPALDAMLRSSHLLDAVAHPEAFFVATHFDFDARGKVQAVRGEFTLRGINRPLTLSAMRFNCYQHPETAQEVCGGDFTGLLSSEEFGITYGLPFVGGRVRLVVQVEGVRR